MELLQVFNIRQYSVDWLCNWHYLSEIGRSNSAKPRKRGREWERKRGKERRQEGSSCCNLCLCSSGERVDSWNTTVARIGRLRAPYRVAHMRANARTRALCLATSIRGDRLPSLVCHSFSLHVSSLYWQQRLQPVVTSPLLPVSFVRSVLLVFSMHTLSFLLASYLFLVFFPSVPGQSFSFSSFALLRLSGFLLSRLGIFVLLVVSQLSWLHLRLSDLLRSLGPSSLLPSSPSYWCHVDGCFFFAFNQYFQPLLCT